MHAHLMYAGGGHDGEKLDLPMGRVIRIGSHAECEAGAGEPDLAPHHCQFHQKGRFTLITDLNSSKGTWVNGHRVASRILKDGDEIVAGPLHLRYAQVEDDARSSIRVSVEENGANSGARRAVSANQSVDVDVAVPGSSRILISRDAGMPVDLGSSLGSAETDPETIARLRNALDTIYRVSNLVLSEDNLDIIFNTVMDVVMETIGPERAYLLMWHHSTEDIEPVVVRRRKGDARSSTSRVLADDEIGPSKGVVLESIRNSLAIITEDAQVDPRFADSPSVKSLGIRAAMCVPVRSATHRIGAIYVDTLGGEGGFQAHQLELLTAIGRQAGLAIERARVYEDMESLFYSCVRALVTTIEAKDAYTAGHSERVAAFSITIAEELNLEPAMIDSVRLGALLHDVGKIGVAEKILTKPARLAPEEIMVIRGHPARGAEILGHIKNIPEVIAAVKWHHEMWNGLGYPDGLSAEQIPLTARIVAVADAFDAMTSNRSYRRNFDVNEAIGEFQRCSGDQFAPEVCEVMETLLRSGRIIPCNELFARGIDVTSRIY